MNLIQGDRVEYEKLFYIYMGYEPTKGHSLHNPALEPKFIYVKNKDRNKIRKLKENE